MSLLVCIAYNVRLTDSDTKRSKVWKSVEKLPLPLFLFSTHCCFLVTSLSL